MEKVTSTSKPNTSHRRARIVVTTHGSLGDLYPYVAIALGLKARRHEVIFAAGECHRTKIESLGIAFRPVRPERNWVTDPDLLRRIMHPVWGLARVIREVLLPVVRETYEDLLAATEGADLLLAMQANYASPLVAEKKGLRWASAFHMPVGFLSAYDPPPLPVVPWLSRNLRFLGPAFCRPVIGLTKFATRAWAKPLHRLRDEVGLPRAATANPLSDGHSPLLHLALFSKWLADRQPDWPPQSVVTGFPWYDQDGEAGLPAELARFLDDGPPPIVFTLGSTVAEDPGAWAFFEHSATAAKLLNRRAVLILNDRRNRPAALPEGVVAFDYVPFSQLFPRAGVIVHHGGIGTTGLAMRSGRPMLIMPTAHDQPDNADRAARLGISRTIRRRHYTSGRVAAELRQLQAPAYLRRAAEIGENLRQEDGVSTACDAIEALLLSRSVVEVRNRVKITFTI